MKIISVIVLLFIINVYTYGEDKSSKISSYAQKHIDNIQKFSESNNWDKVRSEYKSIDWRKIDNPDTVLKTISITLKNSKDAVDIRKDIKTRYELVKEKSAPELVDPITQVVIPVTENVTYSVL